MSLGGQVHPPTTHRVQEVTEWVQSVPGPQKLRSSPAPGLCGCQAVRPLGTRLAGDRKPDELKLGWSQEGILQQAWDPMWPVWGESQSQERLQDQGAE